MSAVAEQASLDQIKVAEKPQAVLLLMVAPSVELLVHSVKVQ